MFRQTSRQGPGSRCRGGQAQVCGTNTRFMTQGRHGACARRGSRALYRQSSRRRRTASVRGPYRAGPASQCARSMGDKPSRLCSRRAQDGPNSVCAAAAQSSREEGLRPREGLTAPPDSNEREAACMPRLPPPPRPPPCMLPAVGAAVDAAPVASAATITAPVAPANGTVPA